MPSDDLAACFVSSRRFALARVCKKCSGEEEGECKKDSHSESEKHAFKERDPCYYHDHGDDEVGARQCWRSWEAWIFHGRARWVLPTYITSGSSKHAQWRKIEQ